MRCVARHILRSFPRFRRDDVTSFGGFRRPSAPPLRRHARLDDPALNSIGDAGGAGSTVGASGRATLAVIPTEWNERRAAMAQTVREIGDILREIAPMIAALERAPAAPGIGHNQPPEPLPIDSAQVQLGISAANVLRTQLSEEQPSFEVSSSASLSSLKFGRRLGRSARGLARGATRLLMPP